jgi:hypothetical protein
MKRRKFVDKILLMSALPLIPVLTAEEESKKSKPVTPPGKTLKRRIIWNNDGDDLRMVAFGIGRLWNARDGDTTPLTDRFKSVQEFMDLRTSAIADIPVTTISYCGVFTWPVWDFPKERISVLGSDPMKHIVDFAHNNGKEFFFNLRMNDCHSSGLLWQGTIWWEPFRLNNPHFFSPQFRTLFGKKTIFPGYGVNRQYIL